MLVLTISPDLRRRGHGRPRLPRALARRLRPLETARPPAGGAPPRRRDGAPVPAPGRRLRAPLRVLPRAPRRRRARGARPRVDPRRGAEGAREPRAVTAAKRPPYGVLAGYYDEVYGLWRELLSPARDEILRAHGVGCDERPRRRLRERLAEPRAGPSRLPGRRRRPGRGVPASAPGGRAARHASRSTCGAEGRSRSRSVPARRSTLPSRPSTSSTTSTVTRTSHPRSRASRRRCGREDTSSST